MNKLTHIATAASLLLGLGLATTAQASPYFEIVGGGPETQNYAGTSVIPNTAQGYDNLPFGGTGPIAMSLVLRDTDALATGARTVRLDYVGSDASFTNQFTAGGGTVNWCNQPTGCSAGFTSPTNTNSWAAPYSATSYITALIGSLIPFTFISDLHNAGGNGTHIMENGSAGNEDMAHLYFAAMSGGDLPNGFYSTSNPRTGTIMGLGLTDGSVIAADDDDHQDLMIRVSVVPEPGSLALLGLGLLAMTGLRRRQS